MKKSCAKNGGSVLIVVVVIAVLAVLAYMFMPVFRAKSDVAIEKATTFSTEQQQKDPVLFIQYVLGVLDKSIDTLQAGVIQLKAYQNAAKRTVTDNQTRKAADETLLVEAKAAYQAASTSGNWPASLHGLQFTAEQLQSRIIEMLKQQRRFDEMVQLNQNYGNELAAKISVAEKDISALKSQRADLVVQLEGAKINQAKNMAVQVGDEVNALLDRCMAIKPPSDGGPSTDALRGAADIQQQNVDDQALFEDFMR